MKSQWVSDLTRAKSKRDVFLPTYSGERMYAGSGWAEGGDGEYFRSPNPAALVHQSVHRVMMQQLVPTLLAEAEVLVIALRSTTDEALGWIAWKDDMLCYVRVLGQARRKGIGAALFNATGLPTDCKCAWMTTTLRKWLDSIEYAREQQEMMTDVDQ